jgi:hypothetical protein
MVQVPLYKSLVALEFCRVHDIEGFDTVHVPRFGDLSAATYTPGTTLTATDQEWDYDTIVISTYKHATFYVDDVRKQTINVDQARELATEAAYQIRDKIDTHVFANITGADGFNNVNCDDDHLVDGGTTGNHRPISAATGSIINVFANAKKLLLENNVEQTGDWCAVITPHIASLIDIKAASSGYNVADSTLRNGYAGDFLGFEVYVSKNLPSGKCTAIANNGASATGVSSTTCKSIYFGRKKMIDLYLQPPRLSVRPKDDMVGSNYVTYTAYGSGITTKNRSRGLNVAVQSGYY